MDNESIMMKDKLGVTGILRESVRIAAKNPKLWIFTTLTSFPLFLSLLLFEFLLQQACKDGINYGTIYASLVPLHSMNRVTSKHFQQFAMLGLTYLVLVHPLDLLNTISIVRHSSALYAGETLQSFKEFWNRPINGFGFKGPLITSLYVLILTAIVTVGLISLGMQMYPPYFHHDLRSHWFQWYDAFPFLLFFLPFWGAFIALLIKYIEWSSVWKVGIVISVLEEKHGDIAIGVAGYLSRGSRKSGFLLMLVFFLWRACLRSLCLYLASGRKWGLVGAAMAQALGACLGNLINWVVFLVYYCDCKKRFLEKKIDVEDGRTAAN